jgi:hypothetical protein
MKSETKYFFIIGSPRSGTSILGELLNSHPDINYIFEAIDIWEIAGHGENKSHRLTEIHATNDTSQKIRDWFKEHEQGKPVLIEKNPRNSLRIPFVHSIFPDAKFIYIFRDGRDVSCSLVPGIGGKEWSHTKPPSWKEYYQNYSGVVRCAHAWKEIIEISLNDLPDVPHIKVRYEDLISSPKQTAEKLFSFIGIDIHEDTIKFCKNISNETSSTYHAKHQDHWFQNDHNTRIERWKENLSTNEQRVIIPLLAPTLHRLGYEQDINILENHYDEGSDKSTEKQTHLCDTPNQHARKHGLLIQNDHISFYGYQEFSLGKEWINVSPNDSALQIKYNLLAPYFQQKYMKFRTLLDLGANAAFFSFWALQKGADKAIAVDIDEDYLKIVQEAKNTFDINNLDIVKSNIINWQESADVVMALALVHWVYSCSATFGSLDSVINKIAELTNYIAFIEWVDPSDNAIQFFNHTQWNQDTVEGPFNLESFEAALSQHFRRYAVVGDVSPTRKIYVAFKKIYEIDLSCPYPLILDKNALISSRCLTTINQVEYWSSVYDYDGKIYKQTSTDLALREAKFLTQLTEEYFPNVLSFYNTALYSVVVLEKIDGVRLIDKRDEINANPTLLNKFIFLCLDILEILQENDVVHRDIRPDNILIRNQKPVLLDFGWAISNSMPYITPDELGGNEKSPDNIHCDIYSMGKVFEYVCLSNHSPYQRVISLMTESQSHLRTKNLKTLRNLFTLVLKTNSPDEASEEKIIIEHLIEQVYQKRLDWDQTIKQLAERDQQLAERDQQLAERDQQLAERDQQLAERDQQLAERDQQLAERDQQLAEIFKSKAWRLISFIREVYAKLFPSGSSRSRFLAGLLFLFRIRT